MVHHADASARSPPLTKRVQSAPAHPYPRAHGPRPGQPGWSGCGRLTAVRGEDSPREKGEGERWHHDHATRRKAPYQVAHRRGLNGTSDLERPSNTRLSQEQQT